VVAGVLLLGFLAVLLGGVFKVKTPDGVIVLENVPKDAEILVDGDKINFTWPGLGKPLEIRAVPGQHKVEVKKEGFTTFGEVVTFKKDGSDEVTIRLEQTPTAITGFLPLFNGKDLTGWQTHPSQPGNWRVEDGILIGSGPAASHLYTERGDYRDFHLRVEARINGGGNSGVFFRSSFGPFWPADHPEFPLGYEAQINSTHQDPNKTGSLLYGTGGILVRVAESQHFPGGWFTLEVIAQGNHFVIKVNGKTTADWLDSTRQSPGGHIALQQLNPSAVAEFRKIEIRELNGADRAPASAPISSPSTADTVAELWVSLFNGRDLAGWTINGNARAWSVQQGVIVTRSENFKTRSYLLTDRDFTDFVLRLDFSLERGSGTGITVRAIPGEQLPMPGGTHIFDHPVFKLNETPRITKTQQKEETGTTHWVLDGVYIGPDRTAALNPPGSWNQLEIEVSGRSMRALVNGNQVLSTTIRTGARFPDGTVPALSRVRGRIGLQSHTGTVRFRNIEIRELR
jgi:hypothetical protein